MKPLIYICSPYRGETKKERKRNVRNAKYFCRLVSKQGGIPFAPHLLFTQFLDDCNPRHRRLGLEMGVETIRRCDELWVFGKPTSGMAGEIAYAMKYQVPVRWFDSEGRSRHE